MKGKTLAELVILILLSAVLLSLIAARAGAFDDVAAQQPDIPQETIAATPTAAPAPTETPMPEPEVTAEPTPTFTPTPVPYADRPDVAISDWKYVLANTDNLLDSDFIPELTQLGGGHAFDSRAVDALNAFMQGAKDAGMSVVLTSTYRSYATQESLFANKLAQYGGDYAAASRIVAIPGSSEHQTGLAADITDRYYEYMNESLADTALCKWMKAHCAEYGFILRFPEDKQEITGIMFEPWHFRYVGEEAAQYIMENGLCLEEFVALYK